MNCLVIRVEHNMAMAARFKGAGKTATMEGSARFELNAEQSLADVAARIAVGVKGSPRVILCLPSYLFAHKTLNLPLTDLRKIREILPARLQGEIALPLENAVFDAIKLSGESVLAIWTQRSEITHAIGLFKEAGLEPEIITSSLFAWRFLPGAPNDCALYDGTAMALVSGNDLSFVRSFSGADPEKQLTATLAALEISDVRLPSKLLFFGSANEAPAIADTLTITAEALDMPNECAALFRNIKTFHQLADLYAVATASDSGTLPNFRRGDLAWTAGAARLRKKLRLTVCLAVAAAALLFGGKALQYRAAGKDIASLNASIASVYQKIFPTRAKAMDEVAEVKGEIRKLTGGEQNCSTLDTLRMLAEAKNPDISGLYETELEGCVLKLKGDARSAQAVNNFRSGIAPFMSSVKIDEIRSRPDGGVTFSMTGAVREGTQ